MILRSFCANANANASQTGAHASSTKFCMAEAAHENAQSTTTF
jgi:hypothetical protein